MIRNIYNDILYNYKIKQSEHYRPKIQFFLQSPNMNDFYNAAETTVVKVLFGQSATIFNNQVSLIWRQKYVLS